MRTQPIIFLFLAACSLPALAEHPSLLLTRQGVADLKAKIASVDFAKKSFDLLHKSTDSALAQPIELPPRGANWYHWYVCPKHGNRLKAGKRLGKWEWEHICSVDSEVFRGDPSSVKTDFDGCQLAAIHRGYASQIRDCGILFQITGDAKYAARARELLLAYAHQYDKYPLHTTQNQPKIGGGKIGCQTLDESVWTIPAAQGADLVWNTLSPDDRITLAQKLFLPAARDVILPHKIGVHNIQCWKNSAVGLVGFLLDDKELIAAAIEDPQRGFRTQMNKGVMDSGQWWEGAWGYHFYTVSACWPLVEAARNHGIDLWDSRYRRLFDGPLLLAMPNQILPNFNDSGYVNLAGQADIYELAYARSQDPRYLPLLSSSPRSGDHAMLFGVPKLPTAAAASFASANYTDVGYAILRSAAAGAAPENQTWACLKYGPHGGGHGHPDKLSFVLYSQGKVVAPDAGITSYGTPMHAGWYHTTLSHSTLLVDEAEQKPAEGKSLAFGTAAGIDYACAQAGPIYPGVKFVRTLALLAPNCLLVVDQVAADKTHTLDFAYHHRGAFDGPADGTPWNAPDKNGYRYLKNAAIRPLGAQAIALKGETGPVRISSVSDGPADLITATGPGASSADRVPMLIWRRTAKDAALAWCITLGDKPATLELQPVNDQPQSRALSVVVTHDGKSKTLTIQPEATNNIVTAK